MSSRGVFQPPSRTSTATTPEVVETLHCDASALASGADGRAQASTYDVDESLPRGDSSEEEIAVEEDDDDDEEVEVKHAKSEDTKSERDKSQASALTSGGAGAPAGVAVDADALGGRGLLRLPAAPDVDVSVCSLSGAAEDTAEEDEHRRLGPDPQFDLRRFLRPGDVINFVGGNRWGHTVLLLATPDAAKTRHLADVELPKADPDAEPEIIVENPTVYVLRVMQSASNMSGIEPSSCAVTVVPQTGKVCVVKPMVSGGVRLASGCDGRPIIADCYLSPWSNKTLEFDLFQLAVKEVAFAAQDQKWSLRTGVRGVLRSAHLRPERYRTRAARRRLGAKLRECWARRPICSTVPARIWQKYLYKRSLRECHVRSPSQGSSCLLTPRTRTKADGPQAHLLFCGRPCAQSAKPRVQVARPRVLQCVCSNVAVPDAGAPPICSSATGIQCEDCARRQGVSPSVDADPEVAWINDVLRLMPLQDDRVTPVKLCAGLLATGLWELIDFALGPPSDRLDDGQSVGGRATWLRPWRLLPLDDAATNDSGDRVALGRNGFTVYCGQQFDRPRQLSPRMARGARGMATGARFGWDGRCGPAMGPQCPACRSFENRLIS